MPTKSLVLQGEEYESLVDDCSAIITEASFNSRWSLIEGYHQLGERVRQFKTDVPITKFVQKLARDIDKHERVIWYAIQFYDKFPKLEELPDGKAASWSKIRQLLPANKKFAEKQSSDLDEIAFGIFRKHGVEDSRTIAKNILAIIDDHEDETNPTKT